MANAFVLNSGREGGYHFQFSAPSLSSKIVATAGVGRHPVETRSLIFGGRAPKNVFRRLSCCCRRDEIAYSLNDFLATGAAEVFFRPRRRRVSGVSSVASAAMAKLFSVDTCRVALLKEHTLSHASAPTATRKCYLEVFSATSAALARVAPPVPPIVRLR